MTSMIWIGIALGGIAALVVGLDAYGGARWAESTRRLLTSLDGARVPMPAARYDQRELEASHFPDVGTV